MSGMTINEVRDARAKAEAQIAEILGRFQAESHLAVTGVSVRRTEAARIEGGVIVLATSVRIDVELP